MTGEAASASAPPRPDRPARIPADLALVAITAIWGATFPVVKSAVGHASPILFNAVRMSLAAACLCIALRPSPRAIARGTWAAGAALGFCLTAGYAFQTIGLTYTTPAKSAFITGLSVVMVPLMISAAWRRPVPGRVWIATVLATLGLYWLVFGSPAAAAGAHSARGEWLTLACAACFAAQIVILGEVASRHPVGQLASLQILFCALFSWLALPAIETPRWQPTAGLWIALAVTAVLATAVTFGVQAWAQQFTPASRAAVIFTLEPVFGWMASYIGWHERLRPLQIGGAFLILSAIGAVEWKKAAG